MPDEIELKLELTPDTAETLETSELFTGRDKTQHDLWAAYFDTPDADLLKAGLSLRVRRSGETFMQTVKATGRSAAGLFVRPEWEQEVAGLTPVIDGFMPIRALLAERADKLAICFEVAVKRSVWLLQEKKSLIEVSLDRGVVIAGERQSPLCEIELELKKGRTEDLFDLARRIDAIASTRIGVSSKCERGYRLLGPAETHIKSSAVDLSADMDAASAFQAIARACLYQYRRNEALLLTRYDTEALHQARVALRRLRSAFIIHKGMLAGDTKGAALKDQLRWLAGKLGTARDLDVLVERVNAEAMTAAIEPARQEAHGIVEEVLGSARARTLILDITEWLIAGSWLKAEEGRAMREESARSFADGIFDRWRKKAKKQGCDLVSDTDEKRHTLRKSAKKLRYASEFYASLYATKKGRRRHKQFMAALEELQNQLGALNDMATAPKLLGSLGLSENPDARKLLQSADRDTLIGRAVDAYDALADAKRFWR